MNKKNSVLMMMLMLLSASLSFAAQESVTFDQARYYVIIESLPCYPKGGFFAKNIEQDMAIRQARTMKDRSAIIASFKAKEISNFIHQHLVSEDVDRDIKIVQEHKKNLEAMLAKEKKVALFFYIPGLFVSVGMLVASLFLPVSALFVKSPEGKSKITNIIVDIAPVLLFTGITKYFVEESISPHATELFRLIQDIKRDEAVLDGLQTLRREQNE